MDASDFRRIALSLPDAEEGSHMGAMDFRVGGRIFATLASQAEGYGNLIISRELQAQLIWECPDLYLPIRGGWGRMGMTHIRLEPATEDDIAGALQRAWQERVSKNAKSPKSKRPAAPRKRAAKPAFDDSIVFRRTTKK